MAGTSAVSGNRKKLPPGIAGLHGRQFSIGTEPSSLGNAMYTGNPGRPHNEIDATNGKYSLENHRLPMQQLATHAQGHGCLPPESSDHHRTSKACIAGLASNTCSARSCAVIQWILSGTREALRLSPGDALSRIAICRIIVSDHTVYVVKSQSYEHSSQHLQSTFD